MASMTSMLPSNGTRVPAWKRIGLELKSQPLPKKRKSREFEDESLGSNQDDESVDTNISRSSRNGSALTPPKRKKSVSFTPDTKREDGDSSQALLAEWAKQQNGGEGEFSSEDVSKFSTLNTHPANIEASSGLVESVSSPSKNSQKSKPSRKKQKRNENPDFESQSKSSVAESKTSPLYLSYLVSFDTARSTWKFNKAQQTSLLKKALDVTCIPSTYENALSAYIRGLRGDQARQRLRSAAEAILTQDPEASEISGRAEDDNTKDKDNDENRGGNQEVEGSKPNSKGIAKELKQTNTMEDPAARDLSRNKALQRQLNATKERLDKNKKASSTRERATSVLTALSQSEESIKSITNGQKPSHRRTISDISQPDPKRQRIRPSKARTTELDSDTDSNDATSKDSTASTDTDTDTGSSSDSDTGSDSSIDESSTDSDSGSSHSSSSSDHSADSDSSDHSSSGISDSSGT